MNKKLEMEADMQQDKKLLQIGEVAKIFHISMGTLRHYEQTGLLQPEYVDEQTGYRYYGVRQLEVLNTIRYLRVLDFPLLEIAEFLHNRDTQIMEEKLVKQKEIIEKKRRELDIIAGKIDHRLEQLRDAVSSKLDQIQIVFTPRCRIAWMKDELKPESYLDLETAIRRLQKGQKEPLAFLGKVGVGISEEKLKNQDFQSYDMVFLRLDDEDIYEGKTEIFPEQECASIRFCGEHHAAPEYYKKLLEYIRIHELVIAGFSREITLIDYGLTNDTDKFVTEIQIPVVRREEKKC